MKKILSLFVLTVLTSTLMFAATPFNMATFEGDLPAGASIDTINGVPYLKVRVDGWSTAFAIAPVITSAATTVKFSYKMAKDTCTFTDNYQAFVQFANSSWKVKVAITDNPASDTIKPMLKTMMVADTFSQMQFAAQSTSSWGALKGVIIYISKMEIKTPFSLATFKGDLPAGCSIDSIDHKAYLKVRVDGWGTAFPIEPIRAYTNTSVKFSYKMDKDTVTAPDAVQAFIQFAPGDFKKNKAITDNPASTTVKTLTSTLVDTTLSMLQLAAQSTVSWGAMKGYIIYISQMEFVSPFNISTFYGKVPDGGEIVKIDNKEYLKMRLNEWSTAFAIDPVVAKSATTVKFSYKMDKDTVTAADAVQAFVQLAPGDFKKNKAITDNPASTEIKELSSTLLDTTFSMLQLAAQSTASWSAMKGYIIYISKMEFSDAFDIKTVVVGKVDDAKDFKASVKMAWDADSVYMTFNVADDSIVNKGTAYQVDNIEIYFDMKNTKNIHWPRNGGWQKAVDEAFDEGDFQLRLVPDSAFVVNNSTRPSGASITSKAVNQVYTRTRDGYQFKLSIKLDSLLPGFAATAGKQIGFDVLISDNDAVASDANRNQITLNSYTDKPFNDPSLWGTLEFAEGGSFLFKSDNTAPAAPANLAAAVDKNKITLTWDASTDNTGILYYNVIVTGAHDSTYVVYPTAAGAVSYAFSNVDAGDYKAKVVAVDNKGNKSKASEEVSATVTSVNGTSVTNLSIYPNPVANELNIRSAENISNVTIFNVAGQLERIMSVNTNSAVVDLSGMNSGIYFVKVQTANGVNVQRIVKR